MNWFIIIPSGIAAIALVIFLVIRNQKDEKEFEGELKEDIPKKNNDAADETIDKVTL